MKYIYIYIFFFTDNSAVKSQVWQQDTALQGPNKGPHCSSVISELPPAQSTLRGGFKMDCERKIPQFWALSSHLRGPLLVITPLRRSLTVPGTPQFLLFIPGVIIRHYESVFKRGVWVCTDEEALKTGPPSQTAGALATQKALYRLARPVFQHWLSHQHIWNLLNKSIVLIKEKLSLLIRKRGGLKRYLTRQHASQMFWGKMMGSQLPASLESQRKGTRNGAI